MALAAIHVADRASLDRQRTYGLYRLEILAALANAALLFLVALYVVVEALRRWGDAPEVLAGPMLVVAVVGLVANVAAFLLLREGANESLNVEGAYLEVLSDLVGSVAVRNGLSDGMPWKGAWARFCRMSRRSIFPSRVSPRCAKQLGSPPPPPSPTAA